MGFVSTANARCALRVAAWRRPVSLELLFVSVRRRLTPGFSRRRLTIAPAAIGCKPTLAGLHGEPKSVITTGRIADHANEVTEHSRIEMVLPKHGPTDGADSIPE